MKVFFSNQHHSHAPDSFMLRGQRVPCPETPERADILRRAIAHHELLQSSDYGSVPIEAVHDRSYLDFLASGFQRWSSLSGASAEIVPNVHPNRNMSHRANHVVAEAGYYQADTSCPISEGTHAAVVASAQCALSAAESVLKLTEDRVAYALCRPPGHHAYADMAGGFCFINNVAVAAQYCLDHGASRVAILDIDVHHGNGTQGIFYHRKEVLTVSLHGDPGQFYPWYAGYAEETGSDAGTGANRNVPLPQGTGDRDYLHALEPELDAIRNFGPDILLIALGLDASEHDPLAFLSITTAGFGAIGARLGQIGLPTVLVQEGGYISNVLGDNLSSFLTGYESSH